MTQANIGYFRFQIGNGASPEVFNTIEEAFSISGVGFTRDLVDATSFDSDGKREYIAGLADGQEITVECNYIPGADYQEAMIDAVEDGDNINFRLVAELDSPATTFAFSGTPLGWVINPSVDDRNTITFTVKISGDITVTP